MHKETLKRFRIFADKYKYYILFFSLFVNISIPVRVTDGPIMNILNTTFLLALLLSGILFVNKNKKLIKWISFFAIATFISRIFDIRNEELLINHFQLSHLSATFLFTLLLAINVVNDMLKRKKVDIKVVLGAISGFLMFGLMAYTIMGMLNARVENAFVHSSGRIVENYDLVYFSFITLTTTGFGDITPNCILAQRLSMATAIVGQIYVAVVIAIIVAKYISRDRQIMEE